MSPYGKRAAAFRKLRKTDPAKNLTERWDFLLEHDPSLARELPFVPMVIARGWAIGGTVEIACSVGLLYRVGRPELVVECRDIESPADTNSLRAATHALAMRVAEGEPLTAGDRVTMAGARLQFEGTFEPATAARLERFPCTAILAFERLFGDAEHDPERPPVLFASVKRFAPTRA